MGQRLIFLLGGARSGKSTYAENWAKDHSDNDAVLFVATAQAFDDDMRDRISAHRASRPSQWQTVEAPQAIGEAITAQSGPYETVVIDCLTLLVSNILLQLPEDCTQADADRAIRHELDALLTAYQRSQATWLIISNEVGMGVVPPYRLGRLYRDALGRANQQIARHADDVLLLVAGLPWMLKAPQRD